MKRSTVISLLVGIVVLATITTLCIVFIPSNTEEDVPNSTEETGPMVEMLDAMQQLMTGGDQFNRDFYRELRSCMDIFDPLLAKSQDNAWQGIIDYWNMGGGPNDPWGKNDLIYIEKNVTNQDYLNMTIYEPCGYASNVAYYHDATEVCSRIKSSSEFSLPEEYILGMGNAFTSLAVMSSFMHMSHTSLGGLEDTRGVRLIAYLIHQGVTSTLPNASCVVTDLSNESRNMTAIEYTKDYMNLYNKPVLEWYNHTKALDIPDYFLTFAGIFTTVATLAFEDEVVDKIIPGFGHAFGVPQDILDFIEDQYIVELRDLISTLNIEPAQKEIFVTDALTTIAKLIYAFLWQEEILTDSAIFFTPIANSLGAKLLPLLNLKLDDLNSFTYSDMNFQEGKRIYPGDDWCNPAVYPHAKWHLESGIGLLDLVFLGDEMHRLLSEYM